MATYRTTFRRWNPILVIAGALLTSQASPFAHSAEPRPEKSATLAPAKCGDVRRLHAFGELFLASQPSPSDFEQLKKQGIQTVINLRRSRETKFDESKIVEGLDMQYESVPWGGDQEASPKVFDKVRTLFQEAKGPILLHCASANRVGAAWIPYRVLDTGATLEQAAREAKIIGLRSPALQEAAEAYVKKKQSRE